MATSPVFNAYSAYYDLLYRDKDYDLECSYIKSLLIRSGFAGKNLLEFGSGTGIHGRKLAKMGFNILGVERSDEMLRQSRDAIGFRSIQGDLLKIDLQEQFDAVLALFHVVSYQTTNHDIGLCFQQANRHLKTGGLFVFDFWYSPAVYSIGCATRVKRMKSNSLEIVRYAEPISYPNENRVDVRYSIFVNDTKSNFFQEIEEIHSMRHFSLPEVEIHSAASGFELVMAEEFLSSSPLGADTWGACVCVRKVSDS